MNSAGKTEASWPKKMIEPAPCHINRLYNVVRRMGYSQEYSVPESLRSVRSPKTAAVLKAFLSTAPILTMDEFRSWLDRNILNSHKC